MGLPFGGEAAPYWNGGGKTAIEILEGTHGMASFDPVSALIGGALIGIAAALLMGLSGRIAGISGIVAGLIEPAARDWGWRLAFVAGLIAAPLIALLAGHRLPAPEMPESVLLIALSGVLVGFGSRLGSGCTSGHGVCGLARLSRRSIVATATFMLAAAIVVAITHHGIGQ
jgi:uncharacterized membrane protein YedE/YeeE